MYIPAIRSIPLLEKKGEFQAETGVSTNSIYANSSYAFTDKIAASINGNLSYRNFSSRYDMLTDVNTPDPSGWFTPDWRGRYAHRYGEVSVGGINMSPTSRMKFEMFGGMGMGRATDIDHFNNDNRYKSDYYSFLVQGNLGLKKRIVETGGSLRLAYSWFNYTANIYDRSEYILYHYKFGAVHVEPMFFARIGKGNLKVVGRIGINFALIINPEEKYSDLRDFYSNGVFDNTLLHFSIGLS